jgi:ferritin-like metal-binding protein YciE
MSTMTEPRELLIHELGDLLFAERTVAKMLPKIVKEVDDKELAQRFELHLEETKEQISNIEKAFAALGEEAKAEKCPAILGLKQEHDDFMKEEKPDQPVVDLFNTGSAARVEHYEIAAYSSAITLANALGEEEASALLMENLEQEKTMLVDAEAIALRLGQESAALVTT